jgi:CheY-like chemotaxis protein
MATILLVEDEKDLREVLASFIEKEGYTVFTAATGDEGLRVATEKTPQLLLVDIRMPVMSGYQMVTKIREGSSWGAKVPIIYLTNIQPESDEEREDIAKTNPIDYIVKGDVQPEYVIEKIKQVLPV